MEPTARMIKLTQWISSDMPVKRVDVYFLVTFIILITDQLCKYIIETTIDYGRGVTITGFFNLVHLRNEGAAFSFLSEAGGWQRYFFVSIAFIISCWLVWSLKQKPLRKEAIGYSLVLGGALANMSDRLYRGAVVDFLDVHWQGMHWPAFNIADMAIVVGVIFLLWSGLKHDSN